ncbi:hypothetical protein FFT09_00795 [Saccharomonospora piscinae]|uniref:hypothetical protein n=1 Tax=Saccharomonospora piscinae TaxID=687388 RepID=UPI00110653F3|nr:hypothetical protein [Saccharomonospora piscinae]TLW94473.1 hypothetical protein FFT09_00795 [Saccharomonospora piscinae]
MSTPVSSGGQRGARLRPVLAAGACVVAAALTVLGTFLPLFRGELSALGSVQFDLAITAWGFDTNAPVQEGGVANNGIPLSVAAALLLVAAVLVAVPALRRRPTPMGRLACGMSAAFLAGITVAVVMQSLSWLETFRATGDTGAVPEVGLETGLGAGLWLLVGATVLALAAVWLAPPPGASTADREPITPRYGFPAPGGGQAPGSQPGPQPGPQHGSQSGQPPASPPPAQPPH